MSYYLIQILQLALFTGGCALLAFLLFMFAYFVSGVVDDEFGQYGNRKWPAFLAFWMIIWTLGPALIMGVAAILACYAGEIC